MAHFDVTAIIANLSTPNAIVRPYIDLRAILATLQDSVSNVGLFFNAILVYLIFFKTTKNLADYKLILIQNCFVDTFFTLINDFIGFQTEYKNGWFIMFISGKAGGTSFPYTFIFMCLWVASLLLCTTFIPVQFIYRYYMVVHDKILTKFQYFCCCLLALFGALSYASSCIPVFWPSEEKYIATMPLLQSDAYYYNGIPTYYAAHISQWPLMLHFIYAMFLVQVSYGITILSCIKVWKNLNNQTNDALVLSEQTKKMHRKMTKTIILQAICPFFCVMLPTGVTVIVTFFQLNIPGLGIIITLSWYW
uniref:Uncharacterized protein n=1 Tax=Panagrolaimus davidi TaxID=227884 RepID=A0A914PU27_9BILA